MNFTPEELEVLISAVNHRKTTLEEDLVKAVRRAVQYRHTREQEREGLERAITMYQKHQEALSAVLRKLGRARDRVVQGDSHDKPRD